MMDCFKNKRVGMLGLAKSGLAAARAAVSSDAEVLVFDDNPESLDAALRAGCFEGKASDIASLDFLIVSPGVPLTHPAPHPLVQEALKAGTAITCDIEVFVQEMRSRGHKIIAVTGTNGKSTTTALITHLLREAGFQPLAGGNIGKAVFELEPIDPSQPIVIEVSSFQLDLCHDLGPDIAVFLNLAPDHLDRHGDMAGYIRAKSRIFDGQTKCDLAVVGIDDEHCRQLDYQAEQISIGRTDADIIYGEGWLSSAGTKIDLTTACNLRGVHNAQNAAAALAVANRFVQRPAEFWQQALERFEGLPHRMEICATCRGVTFINDSKATNPAAAAKSLGSYANIHWIAGGKAKPGGFASLLPKMSEVSRGYVIGDAASEIVRDLGQTIDIEDAMTLEAAVHLAFESACGKEAVVLLAPACASFDQFKSFEDRGDRFRYLARSICGLEVQS